MTAQKLISKNEKTLASFKCLFMQLKALNFARCNSGLHFSRPESSHTPVPCRCWQADQVGGGISCNPSLKLESCYVRPSWFVGSTSVNKQDQKGADAPTATTSSSEMFLSCLPALCLHTCSLL